MNKEKLLALAELLRRQADYWNTLPCGLETHFDMSTWWVNKSDCGFSGCAIGTLIKCEPETTNLRFTIHRDRLLSQFSEKEMIPYLPSSLLFGMKAVAAEFGLSFNQSNMLFLPHCYDNPHNPYEVARNIERFVENDG